MKDFFFFFFAERPKQLRIALNVNIVFGFIIKKISKLLLGVVLTFKILHIIHNYHTFMLSMMAMIKLMCSY